MSSRGGALATGAGLLAVWAAVETGGRGGPALSLLPGLLLYGFGGGIVSTSLIGLALAGVAPEDAGAASGGLLTAVQASEAAGVAGIGAFFSVTSHTAGPGGAFGLAVLVLVVPAVVTAGLLHRLRDA
ncbi:hypothetical protein [Streptomyces sp. PU-14G]|uniref:hypothetical protein n=1 Tax=Streptomyces sp. PU-14G TaxID=2800808 RepID=UPI0034DF3CD0